MQITWACLSVHNEISSFADSPPNWMCKKKHWWPFPSVLMLSSERFSCVTLPILVLFVISCSSPWTGQQLAATGSLNLYFYNLLLHREMQRHPGAFGLCPVLPAVLCEKYFFYFYKSETFGNWPMCFCTKNPKRYTRPTTRASQPNRLTRYDWKVLVNRCFH
jgi:hypothetical protein